MARPNVLAWFFVGSLLVLAGVPSPSAAAGDALPEELGPLLDCARANVPKSSSVQTELLARAVAHDLRNPLTAASEALRLPRLAPQGLEMAGPLLGRRAKTYLGLPSIGSERKT